MNVPEFVQSIIDTLKDVHVVKAIVLGDSWAAGVQHPDSDIDLGLYIQPDTKGHGVTSSGIYE